MTIAKPSGGHRVVVNPTLKGIDGYDPEDSLTECLSSEHAWFLLYFLSSNMRKLWFGRSYTFPTPENMTLRAQLVDEISQEEGTESGTDGGDIKDAFHQFMTYKPDTRFNIVILSATLFRIFAFTPAGIASTGYYVAFFIDTICFNLSAKYPEIFRITVDIRFDTGLRQFVSEFF